MLSKVLEKDLDEDTAARSCLLLIQVDQRKHMPAYSIIAKNMAKEASNVAQSVCFVAMDCLIIFGEGLFEQI
jgi:hypothetical protein